MENTKHLHFIAELEKTMLAAFLQDRNLWASFYEHLKPNYFNTKEVGILFSFFLVYFKKYKALPTKAQTENFVETKNLKDKHIENLIQYIYDKKDKIEKHVIKSLDDEIAKFIRETKIEYAILHGVELLQQGKFNDIEAEIREAVAWNHKIDLGVHIAEVEKRYKQIDELYQNVITTPWPRLDTILGGGIFQKTLTTFAAASSVGKSIALDQLAFHIWDKLKKNVVMITLEVSETRKSMRMDAYGTQIPISEIRAQKEKVFKFYEQRNDYKNKLFIKEFPTSSINVTNIEQYLYHLELFAGIYPEDIGAIIIDYGDIMLPKQRRIGKTYDDQGNTFENMRSMSQEYGPPVISACLDLETKVEEQTKGIITINEVKIGDKLKTHDGYNIVLATTEPKIMKTYKIKTKSGKEIICSGEHIFPTTEGEKCINTGLKTGDKLYIKK